MAEKSYKESKKQKVDYFIFSNYNKWTRDELFDLMIEDTQQIQRRGTSFIQRFELFSLADSNKVHVSPIYRGNFTPYHDHDFYEINYVFEGEVLEYIDGRKFVLERGDLLLMAPEVRHISMPFQAARAYNVLLSTSFITECAEKLRHCDKKNYLSTLIHNSGFLIFHRTHGFAEPIIGDMHDFLRKAKKHTRYRSLLAECMATEMMIHLGTLTCDVYAREENVLRENLQEEALGKRIIRYIDENKGAVDLAQLSEYFGYSTRQIQRLVERYGTGPYAKHVRGVRISWATRYVGMQEMSIAEIAKTCGFESAEYFSRWFKKYRGVTPTEYRKNVSTT